MLMLFFQVLNIWHSPQPFICTSRFFINQKHLKTRHTNSPRYIKCGDIVHFSHTCRRGFKQIFLMVEKTIALYSGVSVAIRYSLCGKFYSLIQHPKYLHKRLPPCVFWPDRILCNMIGTLVPLIPFLSSLLCS